VVWMRPPDPLRDLADERSGAIWAKRGFIALFIAKIASGLITALVLQTVVDDVQRATDSGTNDQTTLNGWQILNVPVSLLLMLGFIAVLIWTYKAANVASKLNYPARHSPGMAIAGWLIPVVNFWFPYQSVRDCLWPSNPERKTVRRWWMLYLIGSFAWLGVVLIAVFSEIGVALAVALPVAVINALELQAALRVVDAVAADHAEAIGRIVTTP